MPSHCPSSGACAKVQPQGTRHLHTSNQSPATRQRGTSAIAPSSCPICARIVSPTADVDQEREQRVAAAPSLHRAPLAVAMASDEAFRRGVARRSGGATRRRGVRRMEPADRAASRLAPTVAPMGRAGAQRAERRCKSRRSTLRQTAASGTGWRQAFTRTLPRGRWLSGQRRVSSDGLGGAGAR
jgi:hypothetical protein